MHSFRRYSWSENPVKQNLLSKIFPKYGICTGEQKTLRSFDLGYFQQK